MTTSEAKPVLQVTRELVSPEIVIPATFDEVMANSRGSAAGHSAISGWLTCPERSRLESLGVRPLDTEYVEEVKGELRLVPLAQGVLVHFLRSLRYRHGNDAAEEALRRWEREIPAASWTQAKLLHRISETNYPLAKEPQIIGVECEVVSQIGVKPSGGPIFRSARYDTVVRLYEIDGSPSKTVHSLEAKTMSRSGEGSLMPYYPQSMVQCALWNANPYLVAQYGEMSGIIWDAYVKTTSPSVERIGPRYVSKGQQRAALRYMAAPDDGTVTFRTFQENGHTRYHRNLHACWGRWSPCQYISACFEAAWGSYEILDKQTGEITPYNGE